MQEYIRSLIPESTGKYLELEKFAEEHMVPIVQKKLQSF